MIVRDPDLEDIVTAVHGVASELTAQGFGAQLLAAAFKLRGRRASGLLDLRVQAGSVLAVRPVGGTEARQRNGA